jgi:antitoxin VapB
VTDTTATARTTARTTVFQSGNSQAVRLPKEFRFTSKTVEIFRRGDEVVLREKKRSFADALDAALGHLPAMTDQDARALDAAMQQAKERRPAEERDWSLLSDAEPAKPQKQTAKKASSQRTPRR